MKRKLLYILLAILVLTGIPTILVSARTTVVHVRADVEWVETGLYVEVGETYNIKSHGIAWTGSPSQYPEAKSGPGGQTWICSSNYPQLPCNLNGQPYGALIGKVGGQAFLIGDATSFTAPASGWLELGVNDDLDYHFDNLAGFTVQFK